jgi:ankyrin repeat protein
VFFTVARLSTPNEMRRVIGSRSALDVRDEHGRTAAMIAAAAGRWRVLALLVDAGADVAVSRNRYGGTALHLAALRGCVKAVRILLGAGADPDARDSEGWTSLAFGVYANHFAVVKILIRAGAAVDAGVFGGGRWWTPLHHAAAAGNAEMVRILLGSGADPSAAGSGTPFLPLNAAFAGRSASVIRLLVEAGADLSARGLFGLSAPEFAEMMALVDSDSEEFANLLLRAAGGASTRSLDEWLLGDRRAR